MNIKAPFELDIWLKDGSGSPVRDGERDGRRDDAATRAAPRHHGNHDWVGKSRLMSALPSKADKEQTSRNVRFVPCVDGSELARVFFTFAGWSVQPCVRPVSAAPQGRWP